MTFKVGVTRDLLWPDGTAAFDMRAFDELAVNPDVTWEWLPEDLEQITRHALCWTDECCLDIAASALRSIADVTLGTRPEHVVNPEVYDVLVSSGR